MKLVVAEPLRIPKERLNHLLRDTLGDRVDVIFYDTRNTDPACLMERCQDADIVALTDLPFRREVIQRCPHLKLICTIITGVDHIDLEACQERGISVCNCPGYSTNAVAEMTFALLLAITRKLISCDQAARSEKDQKGLVGIELEGKTFGILGAGDIGLRVAKIAQAFGCHVICYNRTRRPETGLEFVDLDTLLQDSDIVSLHLPLTSGTQGILNRDRLAKMKPTAILINTARGGLVDNLALAQQLREGRLGGAGLDVLEMEPPFPADHPLLHTPNVIATPHIGFATRDALERRTRQFIENLAGWIEKGVPRYPIC